MNGDEQQTPGGGSWQFKPDATSVPTGTAAADQSAAIAPPPTAPEVTWTASEFVAHTKSPLWYAALAGGAIVVAVIINFITKDLISTATVFIVALVLAALGIHKPRVHEYHIGPAGLAVGPRVYSIGTFKSFGTSQEGALQVIVLAPMKRFNLPITLYCPPDDYEKIANTLSNYLPFAPVTNTGLEQLMHRVRL